MDLYDLYLDARAEGKRGRLLRLLKNKHTILPEEPKHMLVRDRLVLALLYLSGSHRDCKKAWKIIESIQHKLPRLPGATPCPYWDVPWPAKRVALLDERETKSNTRRLMRNIIEDMDRIQRRISGSLGACMLLRRLQNPSNHSSRKSIGTLAALPTELLDKIAQQAKYT